MAVSVRPDVPAAVASPTPAIGSDPARTRRRSWRGSGRAAAGSVRGDRRRAAPKTVALAAGELAGAGVLLGVVQIAVVLSEPSWGPRWALVVWPVVAWIYLAAGVVAWLRRPSNPMGLLMIAGGFAWLAAGFEGTEVPALTALGLIADTVPFAVIVHLLHAFPSGRVRGRLSAVTVLAGYVVCVVLEAPRYLFGSPDGPFTVLQIAYRAELARAGLHLQWTTGLAVMIVTAIVLARRHRRAPPAQRRILAPLFGYGVLAVLFVPVSAQAWRTFLGGESIWLDVTQMAVLAGVPIAFVAAMLRGGFARTGELQELGVWLGADRARPALADALADALGDPSLELLFAVPGTDDYVDFRGGAATAPRPGSGRAAVEVVLGDRRVGAIVYDAALIADRSLVEAAGRVVALALHNEQLTAELRAGRDRLQRALARTVEASDVERRRIARDLHDGLQGRLVVLAMEADLVRVDPALPGHVQQHADALVTGLQASIAELRDLVQGVMPSMLTERGLCAAAEELADRCPIPVALDVDPAPAGLPGAVESTGYFIVAEALANAVKHSGAAAVQLRMTRQNGHLLIELHDDGIGGAHTNGGAGLRGMTDRVEALDGRISVASPPGRGTHIVAELPCAS